MMSLEAENGQLKQEIAELRKALNEALETIKELRAQLGQNSRNSNWPSSRDKGKKRRSSKSLRSKSEKSAGGQPGHEGHTLEFSAVPDRVESHRPQRCIHCQSELAPEQSVTSVQRRQVVDLPPLQVQVVEHQVETVVCRCCGGESRGVFPEGVTQPVQYGPRLKGLSVYLKHVQLIPYERTRALLQDLFGVQLSPGTLENFVAGAARRLQPVMKQVKKALVHSPVVHFDESGFYIGGTRQWLHSASSRSLTYYAPHPARGKQATETIGILPDFTGTAHHDHWSAYWQYTQCEHALCNAHLLRELNALQEQGDQPWTAHFKRFLLATKRVVEAARQRGDQTLSTPKLAQVERLFDRLTTAALTANPPPAGGWPQGKRGRPKKTKARNLAERLETFRFAMLAFVYDFNVPFDNNLAERDIRMLKVQQKISGCFRSPQGAKDFCAIRSYISCLRKQQLDLWSGLNSIFSGQLIEPDYTPV
jgi:transposase